MWQRSPQAIVLLDAPPLGPVLKGAVQRTAETSTVLGTAGRVLLVTDAAHADVTDLAVAVERLEEDGVAVIGVVVNRRRPLRPWSRRRARGHGAAHVGGGGGGAEEAVGRARPSRASLSIDRTSNATLGHSIRTVRA